MTINTTAGHGSVAISIPTRIHRLVFVTLKISDTTRPQLQTISLVLPHGHDRSRIDGRMDGWKDETDVNVSSRFHPSSPYTTHIQNTPTPSRSSNQHPPYRIRLIGSNRTIPDATRSDEWAVSSPRLRAKTSIYPAFQPPISCSTQSGRWCQGSLGAERAVLGVSGCFPFSPMQRRPLLRGNNKHPHSKLTNMRRKPQ